MPEDATSLDDSIMQVHAAVKPLRALLSILPVLERARDAERILAEHASQVEQAQRACADAQLEAAQIRADAAHAAAVANQAREAASAEAARIVAAAQEQGERELAAARGACVAEQTAALDAEERAKSAADVLADAQEKLAALAPQLAEAEATIARAEAIKKVMG